MGSDFRRLWAAAAVSNLGDGVRLAALPLLAAAITRDPVLVAGLTVALRLPWFVFAIPAGELADRFDRRRLMIGASAAQGLVIAVFGVALAVRGGSLPLLYAVAFLLGVGEVTFDTVAQTLVPSTVARDDLDRANGRLIATERVCNELAGPPIGSALFAVLVAAPFLLDAVTFALAAVLLATMTGRTRAPMAPGPHPHPRVLDGIRWVAGDRLFRALTGLGIVINLVSGAVTSILVLYALEDLGIGEVGYGVFLAVLAVGGLAGAVVTPRLRARFGAGRVIVSAAVVQGAGYAVAAFATSTAVAAVALAVVQGAFFGTLVVFFALRQAAVPDRLLGRVTAAMRLVAAGVLPLGAAAGGLIADQFGLRAPLWLGAVVLVVAGLVGAATITNAAIDRALDTTA